MKISKTQSASFNANNPYPNNPLMNKNNSRPLLRCNNKYCKFNNENNVCISNRVEMNFISNSNGVPKLICETYKR